MMWWGWIALVVISGLVAMSLSRRLEQRMIRRLIAATLMKHGIRSKDTVVKIHWGWPLRKSLVIHTHAAKEEDILPMQRSMDEVWAQLDQRYGEGEEEA